MAQMLILNRTPWRDPHQRTNKQTKQNKPKQDKPRQNKPKPNQTNKTDNHQKNLPRNLP